MFPADLDLLLLGSLDSEQRNLTAKLFALFGDIFDLLPIFIYLFVGSLDVFDSSVLWEIEGHRLHEFLVENLEFIDEFFLLVFDSDTLFLLQGINFLFDGEDFLSLDVKFLLSMINNNDIDLMIIKIDIMLLQQLDLLLDLLDENLNLWCQLMHVGDNLHHTIQKLFVLWEIIRILKDPFLCVMIEILEVLEYSLHLVQEKICVDVDPAIDLCQQ